MIGVAPSAQCMRQKLKAELDRDAVLQVRDQRSAPTCRAREAFAICQYLASGQMRDRRRHMTINLALGNKRTC
jgi:hypothetical protein